VLGLPDGILGCLFDLDGVLTKTATLHAAAWADMFDRFLRDWSAQTGQQLAPFDPVTDYEKYVDGKQRIDGTRSFLASRGIHLPDGREDDSPDAHTSYGLGNRKNQILQELLASKGVQLYEGSVRYVRAVRDRGLPRAVVSSSANCREVLEVAHIEDLFEVRIDGTVAKRDHLRGKPAPDMYLAAASALGLQPGAAAVFEDALAGVESGRAGGFGYVVGVDRTGQADALRERGANVVVKDLAELLSRS
jgi:beta-phosphoglucomutase family hydrolase